MIRNKANPIVERVILILVIVILAGVALTSFNRNRWSLMANHAIANHESVSPPPPNHSRAPLWDAQQALAAGDLDAAMALLDPTESIEASRLFAEILYRQGKVTEAITIWESANDLSALIELANTARENSQPDIALMALEAVIRIRSSIVEPYVAIAEVKQEQGLDAEAADWYGKAIELQPRFLWRLTQAELTSESGNLGEAIVLYEALADDYPGRAELQYTIAYIYNQMGNIESAILAIEQANRESQNQRIQFLLLAASLYEQANRKGDAVAMYEAVLQINPNHRQSQNAIDRLTP